ncbi:J domain-containing protein [Fasciola hepatica]|uniref:J domain-containing protein n=1 Tax=Fasciola hepatica TaxID=6192 RepID=A0A2H1CJL9_FASHE|nr:J domain-containing protein [Fasciola hepatica]
MNFDEIFKTNNENEEPNYFTILGVDSSSTADQIDAEFRLRARELHPDKNVSVDANRQFQLLNRARQVLTDPTLSEQYRCWFNSGIMIPFERWLALKDQFKTCMHWSFGLADRGKTLTLAEDAKVSPLTHAPRQCDPGDILHRFRNYQI